MLAGRRIVLGVSGGIAAYKAAYLARRLVEAGVDLRVILTAAGERFVGAQTFAAIAGRPVEQSLFGAAEPVPHTELARWAEAFVVAPATANLMAKLAGGKADDLLSASLLATYAPVLLAPAMHTEMWEHPATRRNTEILMADGHRLVGPAVGPLAGGDEGPGRMVEPDGIVGALDELFRGDLEGWRVLVTAGGTREAIDPVRYIGNRSSGKMGAAIAADAARRGADTVLVSSSEPSPLGGVEVVSVESAEEMAAAVWSRLEDRDVVVMAAAVADFRPKDTDESKLRRLDGPPELVLEPTPDILAGVVERNTGAFVVGFAAEAGSVEEAIPKASRKGVDLLVANDVARAGSGFGGDTNQVTLIFPDGTTEPWPLKPKSEVAAGLWDRIKELRAREG